MPTKSKHPETIVLHAGYRSDPDHDRGRGADLSDHQLPVQRQRACRASVRAGGARQHLYPHHEPDPDRARGARRRAGRRRRGARARLGPGGLAVRGSEHLPCRRQFRLLDRSLWRHLEPVPEHDERTMGIEVRFVDPADPENFRRATDARTRCYYAETLPNPKLDGVSDRRGRQDRPRAGRAADRRQHGGAGPLPAARPRRRRSSCIRRRNISAATAPRSAASSSMAAISIGRSMPTASPC